MVIKTVTESVEAFLDTLALDEAGQARAAIALALASKLDQAQQRNASVGLGAATGGIARELRESLTDLQDLQGEAQAFVQDLFAKRA